MWKKLLFSVLFTLLLLEVSLRFYSRVSPSVLAYHPSRYQKFKAKPGDLSYGFPINPDGFKDMPFETNRAPGEFRVAAIGDSFVFSMVPYADSFCTKLEEKYPQLNVMNFGIIGTGPEDYVTVLKRDVLKYNPDAVLLFLYSGNDFLPKSRKLYEFSAVATITHRIIKSLRSYQGQDINQNYRYDDDMTPFSYEAFVETEARYAQTFYASDELFDSSFLGRMRNVDAIAEICRKHDISLKIVLLPDRMEIEPNLLGDVALLLRKNISDFDLLRLRQSLEKAFLERDIPYRDLTPEFARANRKLFINNDIHINIAGNNLVASSLPPEWFQHVKAASALTLTNQPATRSH
jgi:hypothetical protein